MNEQFLHPILPVFNEVNQLVRTAWALQRKVMDHRAATRKYSDVEWVLEYACLDALRRETIASLCRLDDPAKEYMSLRYAVDHFSKSGEVADQQVTALHAALRSFREKINTFKVSHRNSYIGHLTKRGYVNQYNVEFTLTSELRECILLVFPIVDILCGTELNFVWPIRDSDELINLRFSLENPNHCNAA